MYVVFQRKVFQTRELCIYSHHEVLWQVCGVPNKNISRLRQLWKNPFHAVLNGHIMQPSMSRPPPPKFIIRLTVRRSPFVYHYFTLPLGLVRLAFTELHKSLSRISLSVRRGNMCRMRVECIRSLWTPIHWMINLVRVSSPEKNARVSHSSGKISVLLAVHQKPRS